MAVSVGFILLAHDHPDQTVRLARHLADQGAPLVVHLDRRAAPMPGLAGLPVIQTQAAEWGMIGLVRATLDAARLLVQRAPGIGHVYLISGACLPIRPISELRAYLAAHPGVDFIESVPADRPWVGGGLSEERFTLHHPFPWRRRRRLFDLNVALQRRLGLRRRLPVGLVPHLGSQWWCLSVASLRAILEDPRLPEYLRFFARVWIPDEGFFQSLVRRPGARLGPPLSLVRFDATGQPHVFHDDHADLLAGADHFFARKIDPGAQGLRARFLDRGAPRGHAGFQGQIDERPFAAVRDRVTGEHRGLVMAGRLPLRSAVPRGDTAVPYAVLIGPAPPLADAAGLALHGRLFGPHDAAFAGGGRLYRGNLDGTAALRDRVPEQFLARVIWADAQAGLRTAFQFDPADNARIGRMIAQDRHARLILIDQAQPQQVLVQLRSTGPGRVPVALHAEVTTLPPEALQGPQGWGWAVLTGAAAGGMP